METYKVLERADPTYYFQVVHLGLINKITGEKMYHKPLSNTTFNENKLIIIEKLW